MLWGFRKIVGTPSHHHIHFNGNFHEINHPAIGDSPLMEPPPMLFPSPSTHSQKRYCEWIAGVLGASVRTPRDFKQNFCGD